MLRKYETVVVFDPNLSDAEVAQQIEKIDVTVRAHGGQIERQEVWGRRKLAFKMNKQDHGIYAVLVFTGEPKLVSELKRQLRIADQVLRTLVVDKDQYAPDAQRPGPLDSYEPGREAARGGDFFRGDRGDFRGDRGDMGLDDTLN